MKNLKFFITLKYFFSRSKNDKVVLSQTSATKNQENIARATCKNKTLQRIAHTPDSNVYFLPGALNFSLPSNIKVLVSIKVYAMYYLVIIIN